MRLQTAKSSVRMMRPRHGAQPRASSVAVTVRIDFRVGISPAKGAVSERQSDLNPRDRPWNLNGDLPNQRAAARLRTA